MLEQAIWKGARCQTASVRYLSCAVLSVSTPKGSKGSPAGHSDRALCNASSMTGPKLQPIHGTLHRRTGSAFSDPGGAEKSLGSGSRYESHFNQHVTLVRVSTQDGC